MKFKKIMSVIASAIMLSSTIGFASAATFPAPFDSGSTIIYGAASGNADMAAAINIQTAIGQLTGGAANVPEGSWQVGTTSDKLELGESVRGVATYIDSGDLPILADGTVSDSRGDADYKQYFYFDQGSNSSSITYQKNDNDDTVGLFYKIASDAQIARYLLEFTGTLDSETSSTSHLTDIEDQDISILGKSYTITKAVNTSATNLQLTLMGGANKVTVSNGEEITVGGKAVSVLVSSTTQVQVTVDGETPNKKLNVGDTYKLKDDSYIGVSDITYQNFAGGLMQATLFVGADKLELFNGTSMSVNGESVGDAAVDISASVSSNIIAISSIAVNMTAEDDLFVGEGDKLSAATDLDKPEVLISQNWDITYGGLVDTTYEEVSIKPSSSDARYTLTFVNAEDDTIELPLLYSNTTGVFPGEKLGYELRLNASSVAVPITKDDYFILNTADPISPGNDARSFVVQYKGSDKTGDTAPKMKFDVKGVGTQEVTLSSTGTADLKLGGATFSFKNASQSATTTSDVGIALTTTDYVDWTFNNTVTNYLRTKNNALISIRDTNISSVALGDVSGAVTVNLTLDDTNRDGDYYSLTAARQVFLISLTNDTDGDVASSITGNTLWVEDPDNSDLTTYIDNYGVDIVDTDSSASPASLVVKIPESIVEPMLYIASGAVTSGTTGGLAVIVDDSKIDTVKSGNLVVVGGSCINTVAQKILGSEVALCAAEFTAKTGVGPGQYIIKTIANPYLAATSGKIAMLVAGYEAADTANAATKVAEKTVSTEIGSQVYPIVSA